MFDYSTFDTGTFDFLPSTGVTPPPAGPVVEQVIGLDGAYGSALVTRFTQASSRLDYVTGQGTAIVLEAGIELDPTHPVVFTLTRPDGTHFTVLGYVGSGAAATVKGIFLGGSYGVCILTALQLNQAGLWTAYLTNGTFTSAVEPFVVKNVLS